MLGNKRGLPRRPMVSPDGLVWWMRGLHRVRNLAGVYMPKTVMDSLGWDSQTVLMVWQQKDVVCIKELKEVRITPDIKPQAPRSWEEWDREKKISIFQEK